MNNNTPISLIFGTLLKLNVILPNARQFIRQGKCLARLCPYFMSTFSDVIFPNTPYLTTAIFNSDVSC